MGKWGAAEELALSGKKVGKRAGLTPWQILKNANPQDGDCEFSAMFREYADAFRGTRQLVWSPNLKAMIGINEVTDAEASKPRKNRRSSHRSQGKTGMARTGVRVPGIAVDAS